jgi:hypothetical protein
VGAKRVSVPPARRSRSALRDVSPHNAKEVTAPSTTAQVVHCGLLVTRLLTAQLRIALRRDARLVNVPPTCQHVRTIICAPKVVLIARVAPTALKPTAPHVLIGLIASLL